jgi:hypothetical protein
MTSVSLSIPTLKHYRDKYPLVGEISVGSGIVTKKAKTTVAKPKLSQTVETLVMHCNNSNFIDKIVLRRNALVEGAIGCINKLVGNDLTAHTVYLKDPIARSAAGKSSIKLKITQHDGKIKVTDIHNQDIVNYEKHKCVPIVDVSFVVHKDAVKIDDDKKSACSLDDLIKITQSVKTTMQMQIHAKYTVTYWKKSTWTITIKFVVDSITVKSSTTANLVLELPPCRPQTSASAVKAREKVLATNKVARSTEIVDSIVSIMKETAPKKNKSDLAKIKSAKNLLEKEKERAFGLF